MAAGSRLASTRREERTANLKNGLLAPFIAAHPVYEASLKPSDVADESQEIVLAAYWLQEAADYRAALQRWFRILRPGGRLLIAVPHAFLYDRRLSLPARWNPVQRRLYTPRALLDEIEEALEPNSYRVRFLADDDSSYDYAGASDREPAGLSDVVVVLEKIAAPAWTLDVTLSEATRAGPDYAFEPPRTRIEVAMPRPAERIVILKLDHLGDFIMGTGALERARAAFPAAHITLVVGSWNLGMARDLGLADEVIGFDAFPGNSSEEEVDVAGKAALLERTLPGHYDLAVDLRTDPDTRLLLRQIKAAVRAGIGTHAQFPFLDIALPIDFTRGDYEAARERIFSNHDFASQDTVTRSQHRHHWSAKRLTAHRALIWGPYVQLRAGNYIFEPYLEIEPRWRGSLVLDVALDTQRLVYETISTEAVRLPFAVTQPQATFEFRIWPGERGPSPAFSFFGGRLMRQTAESVLHQSEYLQLLIELVALRMTKQGMPTEQDAT